MNAIIKRIILFGEADKKRELEFDSGLNVISGDSKTGKSAIIEIVDYCLFASRSTIPKGVIENFVRIYVLVLKVEQKFIIIGRPSPKSDDWNKVYINIETSEDFMKNFNKDYFVKSKSRRLKDGQIEVESHLGISASDTRVNEDADKRNYGKVSLRSFVSLLFQHQNLIANKHSLFYRFDDNQKRKKTVEDFPILMGWEDEQYFLLRREIQELQEKLKAELRLIQKLKVKDEELREKLYSTIEAYYDIIGIKLDSNIALSELKHIGNNLPEITPISYANSNIAGKVIDKKNERTKLFINLNEKQKLLEELSVNSDLSNDLSGQLNKLQVFSAELLSDANNHTCPVCNNEVSEVTDSLQKVNLSRESLITEVSKVGSYKRDSTEKTESLRKERDEIKRELKKLTNEIDNLVEQEEGLKGKQDLRDKAYLIKGITEANVKMALEHSNLDPSSEDIEELKDEIERKKAQLDGFDLKSKIQEAEVFLSDTMGEIASKLDFEEELKPGQFRFSLDDFNFYYHFKNREKIRLSEMGSGANWLTSHLSLFLSLLFLNCKTSTSSIPTFLILDQPSQVYFPKTYGKNEDLEEDDEENIKQVKTIFSVINDTIKKITVKTGVEPQVIVMDHAEEQEFADFIKYRWKKNGEKLI